MANGLNKILFPCHVNLLRRHITFLRPFQQEKKKIQKTEKQYQYVWAELIEKNSTFGLRFIYTTEIWAEVFLHKSIYSRFYTDHRETDENKNQNTNQQQHHHHHQ